MQEQEASQQAEARGNRKKQKCPVDEQLAAGFLSVQKAALGRGRPGPPRSGIQIELRHASPNRNTMPLRNEPGLRPAAASP